LQDPTSVANGFAALFERYIELGVERVGEWEAELAAA
jgi:hypothetical protein